MWQPPRTFEWVPVSRNSIKARKASGIITRLKNENPTRPIIYIEQCVGRRGSGREKGEERERKEKKRREKKKKRKEKFRVCSGFQNPNLYFSRFFGMKFCFCVFFIVFTIFNKYDTKMNFQANTLN